MGFCVAIFLGTLSTVFVPLPEEATLLAAGYAARLGRATLTGAALAAWAAVLVGDTLSYFVGRLLLARVLTTRLGQKLIHEGWRRWGERLVASHGARAIVIARFLVGLRGFVYWAIGTCRYPFWRFLLVDAAAALAQVGGLVGVGFALGEMRARVAREADVAIVLLLITALLAPWLVRRLLGRPPASPGGCPVGCPGDRKEGALRAKE